MADLADVFRDSLRESGGLQRAPVAVPARLEPGVRLEIHRFPSIFTT